MVLNVKSHACAFDGVWDKFLCEVRGDFFLVGVVKYIRKSGESPVTKYTLSSDHRCLRFPALLGKFDDSVLLLGVYPSCGVVIS